MKRIDLKLSELGLGRIKVKGQLYATHDPIYLVQDILEIDLVNGISIDVGWHPESDPNGSFRIVVFQDFWRNQLRDPIRTTELFEVVDKVRSLVVEYSKSTIITTCSGESRHEIPFMITGHAFRADSVRA